MPKPVILVFIHRYLPGYKSGGPVRSIANLVDRLGNEFDFRIVTRDRDSGDAAPYENVKYGSWVSIGKAKVLYLLPKEHTLRKTYEILINTKYDLLYLNSLFNPFYSLFPVMLKKVTRIPIKPVVIAPRGELSPGALAINPLKKKSILCLSRALRLHQKIFWQASAREDESFIQSWYGEKTQVKIANNIPSRLHGYGDQPKRRDKTLRVVFLSRISEKKNLDGALRILRPIDSHPIHFTVFGVREDPHYWENCTKLAAQLPANIVFKFCGPIDHQEVAKKLSAHDLFFFPTLGENYGHVIVEAFQAGLPVLISDQTPWRGLEERGVGWDISLDNPERFYEVIEKCCNMTPDEFEAYSKRAYEFGSFLAAGNSVVDAHRQLFKQAINPNRFSI